MANEILGHGQPEITRVISRHGNSSVPYPQVNMNADMRNESPNPSVTNSPAPSHASYRSKSTTRVNQESPQDILADYDAAAAAIKAFSGLPPPERYSQQEYQDSYPSAAAQHNWNVQFASPYYGQPPRGDPTVAPYPSHGAYSSTGSTSSGFRQTGHNHFEQTMPGSSHYLGAHEQANQPGRSVPYPGPVPAAPSSYQQPMQRINEQPSSSSMGLIPRGPVSSYPYHNAPSDRRTTEPPRRNDVYNRSRSSEQSTGYPVNARRERQSRAPHYDVAPSSYHGNVHQRR